MPANEIQLVPPEQVVSLAELESRHGRLTMVIEEEDIPCGKGIITKYVTAYGLTVRQDYTVHVKEGLLATGIDGRLP